MGDWSTRLRRWARDRWHASLELHERRQLLLRPWEEEYLHWSAVDGDWQLHGYYLPPPGRSRGVTRDGWCLAALDRRHERAQWFGDRRGSEPYRR